MKQVLIQLIKKFNIIKYNISSMKLFGKKDKGPSSEDLLKSYEEQGLIGDSGAKFLKDHSLSGADDTKTVSNYSKLDRYQKFEKFFPFYHMDVNGYILNIRRAI